MGWFDIASYIPSRYVQDAQQMAPSGPEVAGTAPENPGYTATGARRRFGKKTKKGGRRKQTRGSKKTSR
jgi:hypothetical protein